MILGLQVFKGYDKKKRYKRHVFVTNFCIWFEYIFIKETISIHFFLNITIFSLFFHIFLWFVNKNGEIVRKPPFFIYVLLSVGIMLLGHIGDFVRTS